MAASDVIVYRYSRHGANGASLPRYQQVNFSIVQPISTGFPKGLEFRFDVINLLDKVYQIRIGQGLGVFAPQFRPRRTFLTGLTQRSRRGRGLHEIATIPVSSSRRPARWQ
jgi:hypothetical protein